MKYIKNTKIRFMILIVLALVLSFPIIHIVQAVTAEPGTDGDPLVSQSYIDLKVNELNTKITELSTKAGEQATKVNDLTAQVKDLTAKANDLVTKNTALVVANDKLGQQVKELQALPSKFEKIQVLAGKQLLAGASTELVLRSGKATAIGSKAGGVSDLISGKDLVTGNSVTLNHLLLFPVDDGRGIKAVSDIWVLVKGAYTIK